MVCFCPLPMVKLENSWMKRDGCVNIHSRDPSDIWRYVCVFGKLPNDSIFQRKDKFVKWDDLLLLLQQLLLSLEVAGVQLCKQWHWNTCLPTRHVSVLHDGASQARVLSSSRSENYATTYLTRTSIYYYTGHVFLTHTGHFHLDHNNGPFCTQAMSAPPFLIMTVWLFLQSEK